jgi:hypothetical protein
MALLEALRAPDVTVPWRYHDCHRGLARSVRAKRKDRLPVYLDSYNSWSGKTPWTETLEI